MLCCRKPTLSTSSVGFGNSCFDKFWFPYDRAMEFSTDPAFANRLDEADELARFRSEFEFPTPPDGAAETIYFVGNSLGALPTRVRASVNSELDRWATLGVHGHFTGEPGWADSHETVAGPMERMVGARSGEVVSMNALTVNLHLLLISFYEPTPQRHKILIEDHAFPSDHFAVESQIRQRGFDPATSLVTVSPRPGEELLDPADILAAIAEHGDELATVLLPGVQYYTGQIMPIAEIVEAGHAVGARVGIDLAHGVGNMELSLHDWNVDFATWCTYKYLNASPGSVSGIFVHERHIADQTLPKLVGWWGTRRDTRFEMENVFDAIPTAESWQISNGPVLQVAALRASLEIFDEAGGMAALRTKSRVQTAYLQYLIDELLAGRVESITPDDPERRGCQLSLKVVADNADGQAVFDRIEAAGVFCDWRFPDVIRVAPTPLYNTFVEIRRFVHILDQALTAEGAGPA